MCFMIIYEIKQYHIQYDIKLNIRASTVMLQPLALVLFWWISSFRICITFAYELKRSLQSLLFDV